MGENQFDDKSTQSFDHWNNKDNIFISRRLKVDRETHMIEGEKDMRLVVSKYMSLNRFCNAVKKGTFSFSTPLKWNDPFEMLFYKHQVFCEGKFQTVNICCFAANDFENEEGFWNIWSMDTSETIIRVTYDITKLLEELVNHSDVKFYLGTMDYMYRNSILSLVKKRSKDYYKKIDEYLNDLCLKRHAYKYEIELRLFAVRESQNNQESKDELYELPIDYSKTVVTEVTLPPMKPFENWHPCNKNYKRIQNIMNQHATKQLEQLRDEKEINFKITQSALYCPTIKKRVYNPPKV